jgi:hypothetical protein
MNHFSVSQLILKILILILLFPIHTLSQGKIKKISMTKRQMLMVKYVHEILPEISDSGKVISTRISIQVFGGRNSSFVTKDEALDGIIHDVMKNADVPSIINIKCEMEDKPGYPPRVACLQVLIKKRFQKVSPEKIQSMEDSAFFKEGWLN